MAFAQLGQLGQLGQFGQPRTLFAWFIVLFLIASGIFFAYHIMDASNQTTVSNEGINGFHEVNPVMPENAVSKTIQEDSTMYEPLDYHVEPQQMPRVVGQTEEDLRATRQVMETPPSIEYPEPEAQDPLETVANNEAEFGDNLRHPEQTIEIQPPMGTMRTPASDLSSDELPSLGGHQSVQYSPEMAQNGGEFMSGIFAFDISDGGGIGYSMI
jgi:hypothetical protein